MKRVFIFLLFVIGFLAPSSLSAASPVRSNRLHLGFTLMPIGFGWPKAAGGMFIATRAGISVGMNNHWITFSGGILGPFEPNTSIDINSPSAPSDENSFWDIGLLYGRRLSEGDDGYIYAAAGLARTNIKIKRYRMIYSNSGIWEDNNDQEYTVWGFPIELQAVAKLSPRFGLGVCLFENFNEKKSFGGMSVGFRIGP
jgi:hypothetical protein